MWTLEEFTKPEETENDIRISMQASKWHDFDKTSPFRLQLTLNP
jgi:hypothetical protein